VTSPCRHNRGTPDKPAGAERIGEQYLRGVTRKKGGSSIVQEKGCKEVHVLGHDGRKRNESRQIASISRNSEARRKGGWERETRGSKRRVNQSRKGNQELRLPEGESASSGLPQTRRERKGSQGLQTRMSGETRRPLEHVEKENSGGLASETGSDGKTVGRTGGGVEGENDQKLGEGLSPLASKGVV